MKPERTVTIDDIARAAGVSTATVSRAINQPDVVRQEVRTRIEQTIRDLGYVRHGAARALASARSHTVGVVIPTLESAIFASGVNAIEGCLNDARFTMLLSVSNYDAEHELNQVRTLLERGIDGIILVGKYHADDTINLLEQHACPFVTTWTYSKRSPFPCVGFSNKSASAAITDHLLDIGHTRLGVIAGIQQGNDRAQERVAGIERAMKLRGLSLQPNAIVERSYEIDAGRDGFRALMDKPVNVRPTAILCGNDVLAVGAITEARNMCMRVPHDVSVTGFDDLPIAKHLNPPLTTVHVPSQRMGAAAAEYILSRISEQAVRPRVELPTDIIIRESTAPPTP